MQHASRDIRHKAIRAALYTKLNVASVTSQLGSGSASLVHGPAQPSAAYPICSFAKQSGRNDDLSFGGDANRNQIWTVKGIVRGTSASVAEDIDKAVAELLHFSTLTITGGTTLYLAREGDVEYPETEGDQTYYHVGGLYRIKVR